MAKFLVMHPVGKEMTLEAGTPIAQSIKAHVSVDAYWTGSVYAQGEGKPYCHWDDKDAEAIRQVISKAAPDPAYRGSLRADADCESRGLQVIQTRTACRTIAHQSGAERPEVLATA